jgi:hypothetical protein
VSPAEKKWVFWTSSEAFRRRPPPFFGLTRIPFGETWVLKNGTVLEAGTHFIMPFVNSVVKVKNAHPVSMGIITNEVSTKDGTIVNAYAVTQISIDDPAKSTFYRDPQTNRPDSEAAAGYLLKRVLSQEMANISVSSTGEISEADKTLIADKMKAALKTKANIFGLSVIDVDFRGAFSPSYNLQDRLRAFDPPPPDPNAPGHNLSADYWADVLPPPFFEKFKFGSRKELKAAAAVSLEWSVPSPPDYHHFNMLPKMTTAEGAPPSIVEPSTKAEGAPPSTFEPRL